MDRPEWVMRKLLTNPRAIAVAGLLAVVQDILITYRGIPEAERELRWAAGR